jgi:hypothetical protein
MMKMRKSLPQTLSMRSVLRFNNETRCTSPISRFN